MPHRIKPFLILTLTLFLSAILISCAFHENEPVVFAKPAWRLIPEAIVLGEKHQFFLYGRHLDSAEVIVSPSVKVEKGILKSDGRVLSLYITASELNPAKPAYGEKTGSRDIQIKTPDTSATFTLKVVDEAQPR